MRSIPAELDPAIVADVDATLDAIVRDEGVSIPWAVESGSRAWGFPSPDSDYDGRFIYVRPAEDYLSIWPRRDVIEAPLVGELDINGWGVAAISGLPGAGRSRGAGSRSEPWAKALRLILKGNAVIFEWLQSPIVYRGDATFRDALLDLGRRHADRNAIGRHYLYLGERQRRTYFGDGKSVAVKKLFYALRPAAALRWLRMHAEAAMPPMYFPTLMAECDPPHDVAALTEELIARKAMRRELGEGPLPEVIERFVAEEFEAAREAFDGGGGLASPGAREEADAFFRSLVTSSSVGAEHNRVMHAQPLYRHGERCE